MRSALTHSPLAAILRPDSESSTPLYLQLAARLRTLIESGTLKRNDAMPPERELAILTGLSRVTVRKAIEILVEAGLLVRRPSSGTFVTGRLEQPLSTLMGFSEDMRARGFEPGSIWLDKSLTQATPEEAMALGVAPGAPVIRLERIRTADGERIAIERAVVSALDVPTPELVSDSLYEALQQRGLVAMRALQRLRAALADQREARLLDIVQPSAILKLERRAFLRDGRAVEVTFSSYRADFYDFVSELRVGG